MELIDGIIRRQWSPEEAVGACHERTQALEPLVHAWTHRAPERALAEARRIGESIAAGTFKGRLYGVPIGIKDIFNTADMPTEMGSRIWKDFQPGNDAR